MGRAQSLSQDHSCKGQSEGVTETMSWCHRNTRCAFLHVCQQDGLSALDSVQPLPG